MIGIGNIMNLYGMSDRAVLREIGHRLKRKRLSKNLSQQKLAELAGLNRTTISDIETGKGPSLLTLVQVLRGLNSLEEMDSFMPEPGISPLQLARMKGKQRQRASTPRKNQQGRRGD
jgi:transcriptional regulator with XRE-family HTH domain